MILSLLAVLDDSASSPLINFCSRLWLCLPPDRSLKFPSQQSLSGVALRNILPPSPCLVGLMNLIRAHLLVFLSLCFLTKRPLPCFSTVIQREDATTAISRLRTAWCALVVARNTDHRSELETA
jgi:hypothetical protein